MRRFLVSALLLFVAIPLPVAQGDEEGGAEEAPEDEVPVRDLRAGDDEKRRYFLIGPKEDEKGPEKGFRVLLVMPGGDGGPDFRGFVTNIRRQVLSEDWVVAQLVSVRWTEEQRIVWPTKGNPVPEMKFTTEDFVKAVVTDLGKRHRIDERFVFTLSWSSGGPAAYAVSLTEKSPVTGSFVAMSVFQPDRLPPLSRAKGKAYFIDHSPDDKVCPFRTAEEARDALKRAGARVEFSTYAGGHGWHGDLFGRLKKGIRWLEENHSRP